MSLLKIKKVSKHFSGLTALDKVSLSVNVGEIRGLIGPNGAGKSTLFKNITGRQTPSEGEIYFDGILLNKKPAHKIAQLGIASTFQETTLFSDMTVYENIFISCHLSSESSVLINILQNKKYKEREVFAKERTLKLMDTFDLTERGSQLASELSLGSQRCLTLAITLATEPKLILLDEPFAGMTIDETKRMMTHIRRLKDRGKTIILVEHDMRAVMGICEYITVLNFGTLLAEGTPTEIFDNQSVITAYLGRPPESVS